MMILLTYEMYYKHKSHGSLFPPDDPLWFLVAHASVTRNGAAGAVLTITPICSYRNEPVGI